MSRAGDLKGDNRRSDQGDRGSTSEKGENEVKRKKRTINQEGLKGSGVNPNNTHDLTQAQIEQKHSQPGFEGTKVNRQHSSGPGTIPRYHKGEGKLHNGVERGTYGAGGGRRKNRESIRRSTFRKLRKNKARELRKKGKGSREKKSGSGRKENRNADITSERIVG